MLIDIVGCWVQFISTVHSHTVAWRWKRKNSSLPQEILDPAAEVTRDLSHKNPKDDTKSHTKNLRLGKRSFVSTWHSQYCRSAKNYSHLSWSSRPRKIHRSLFKNFGNGIGRFRSFGYRFETFWWVLELYRSRILFEESVVNTVKMATKKWLSGRKEARRISVATPHSKYYWRRYSFHGMTWKWC